MRKLEPLGVKYSSQEFARELIELSEDISDSIDVDLDRRTGERNLIRNSGQYWRAVGLIAPGDTSGKIRLTDFGRKVADREISQTEFAAITIQTFHLPNPQIQSKEECKTWLEKGLTIHPLKLVLKIICELSSLDEQQGYITPDELTKIIIPLSGVHAEIQDYVNFIVWYRAKKLSLIGWPNCIEGANDFRIAREYLLFLFNYGYLVKPETTQRRTEKYCVNLEVLSEIHEIIQETPPNNSLLSALGQIRSTEVISEFERKRIQTKTTRPNQATFRREVLKACERCVITNVMMPEILEAAHIKPFKYNGEDTIANGFAMRVDIHTLFDTGHLRISPDGDIDLSTRARMDYGWSIPPRIVIPSFTNREFLRWRWENYNGM
ncbi:MAG: AlwI family type II restriction endonuclease [Selenomonadaceae bacterium]|nr:AlwI family type II restriction endonuclease [Selenomonadaceae bacterium]